MSGQYSKEILKKETNKQTNKPPNSVRVGNYKIKLTLFIDDMVPTGTKRINIHESSVYAARCEINLWKSIAIFYTSNNHLENTIKITFII